MGSHYGTPTLRSPSVYSRSPPIHIQRSGTRSPRASGLDKTLRDLAGNWTLNQELSTELLNFRETNSLSSSTTEKASNAPPANLTIIQSHYPSQIFVKTILNEVPTTERWYPPQRPGQWSDWRNAEGDVRSRCRWVKGSDFEQKEGIGFLTDGIPRLGEFFEAEEECSGRSSGWRSVQVWFVEKGRLARRSVRIDGKGRQEMEFVYDFAGK